MKRPSPLSLLFFLTLSSAVCFGAEQTGTGDIPALMSRPEFALQMKSQLARLPADPVQAADFLVAPLANERASSTSALVNTAILSALISPKGFAPKLTETLSQSNDSRETIATLERRISEFNADRARRAAFIQAASRFGPRLRQSLDRMFDGCGIPQDDRGPIYVPLASRGRSPPSGLTGVKFPEVFVHYEELSSLARRLISDFPPKDYVVVAIGRSPAPLSAFLQSLHENYAFNLPLSRFRHYYHPVSGFRLSADRRKALFSHFDGFVPSAEVVGSKKIVVLDYTISGESLYGAYHYLDKYLKERGRPSALTAAALTTDTDLTGLNSKFHDIRWKGYPVSHFLESSFESSAFDGDAEYGEWAIDEDPIKKMSPSDRNKKYLDLKKALAKEIRRDGAFFP